MKNTGSHMVWSPHETIGAVC